MWSLHRRHLTECPQKRKGWNFTLCDCPVWASATLPTGQRVRKSLGTNDWNRATERLAILERGGELTPEIRRNEITVSAAVEHFLKDCRHRDLAKSTIDSYTKTLSFLDQILGLSSISPTTLDEHRDKRKIAASTWRKELETLRAFFAFAISRGWIKDNPAKKVRMPQTEELVTQPFEADEIQKLIVACGQIASDNPSETAYVRKRSRALVLTLLYSGLRISDVMQLRRTALDSETSHLTLRVQKTGVPIKVLLHPSAKNALETLPLISGEYFFWSGNGDLITCIKNSRRTIQRLGKLANVHAYPHRFRDTFAVQLLTNGADIRTVQKLLGHKSVRTTEKHYAHFVAAHQALLDAAASTLNFEAKPARPLLVKSRQHRKRNA